MNLPLCLEPTILKLEKAKNGTVGRSHYRSQSSEEIYGKGGGPRGKLRGGGEGAQGILG